MLISANTAPLDGQTVYQTQAPSDVQRTNALAARLADEAIAAGLIGDAEREKYLACFEEAIRNAIVHGNAKDPRREVFIRLFYDDGEWGVLIEDQGAGFRATDVPDAAVPDYPWCERGRGLKLMDHVMDRVEFFDSGSSALLTKAIGPLQLHEPTDHATACSVFLKPVPGKGTVARLVILHAEDDDVSRVIDALRAHCEADPDSVLVLDFGSVDYLNSSNIANLVSLLRIARANRVDLRVAALREDLVQLFGILRLTEILAVFETIDQAFEQTTRA